MGKFLCECGYRFSDTVLPNKLYFSLVPSELVWETPEKISPTDETEIWECPECKGLTRFDGTAYRTCYYKRVDDPVTDLVASEPLANTDAANPPEAIEDKLRQILEVHKLAGDAPLMTEGAIELIQAIITTETTYAKDKAIADFCLSADFKNAGGDIRKLNPVILGFEPTLQEEQK